MSVEMRRPTLMPQLSATRARMPVGERSTAAVLLLLLGLVVNLSVSAPARAQYAAADNMNPMDHGPFVSSTITLDPSTPTGIMVYKGIAVRVSPEAVMVFDTDLLRVAGAWTGGQLHWYPARDGLQEWPSPDGFLHFTNAQRPGWGVRDLNDPRPRPYGPLPDDRRYKGLHLHGEEVVFSYAVAGSDVLELFGFRRVQNEPIFTRTLSLTPTENALALHVVQAPEGRSTHVTSTMLSDTHGYVQIASGQESRLIGFRGLPEQAEWRLRNHHLVLTLPELDEPLRFEIAIGPLRSDTDAAHMVDYLDHAPPVRDLGELQAPGPGLWEVLETRALVGTDDGPFAVDELVLPRDNPWNSHLRLSAVDFLSDGRAVIASLSGDVWLVDGIAETLGRLRWQRFATGLNQPLGLRVVEDRIYVTGRDQITLLHDLNGDGHADFYESFNNEVMAATNFHAFNLNLETDSEGNFYFAKATPWPPESQGVPAETTPHHGVLFRLSPDGTDLEIIATGMRNPNGLSIGPDDEIYYADNEGHWVPTSKVHVIRQGGFHGYVPSSHMRTMPRDEDFVKPIVWTPHFVDHSPAQPRRIASPAWPDELQGDLLLVSYGRGNLALILLEDVDGQEQGAHLALPLEFQSGLQHTRFHTDGHLYVVGLTNWQSVGHGGEWGSFHRVRYTGQPLHLPVAVHTRAGGLELRFSEALDPNTATDPQNYKLEQWTYTWNATYGSRQGLFSVDNPGEIGADDVDVQSVQLSDDGRSVFLEIAGLEPGPVRAIVPIREDLDDQIEASLGIVMAIDYTLRTADGAELDHLIHKTIHRVPSDRFQATDR